MAWLDRKAIYYQDPDVRDFELYHFGLEQPEDLMQLFRALDTMKHADPELFLELVGINAEDGGRSPYFGSFLHKAIYNTQRVVDRATPELGELALRTMLTQLLTLNTRVKTYAGVVSQESLKAMASEMRKSIDAASTPTAKTQTLLMMAVPFTQAAIDAEVRRQLEALRETNLDTIQVELARRIDDIEHPLKLLEYIATLPVIVLEDIRIQKQFKTILLDLPFEPAHLQEWCRSRNRELLIRLYDRIPLLDERAEDLGENHLQDILVRDALSLEGRLARAGLFQTTYIGSASSTAQFAVGNTMTQIEMNHHPGLLLLTEYIRHRGLPTNLFDPKRASGVLANRFVKKALDIVEQFQRNTESAISRRKGDQDFVMGKMIAELFNKSPDTQAFLQNKAQLTTIIVEIGNSHPDQVFLSLLTAPKGAEAAFALFDTFCDLVPAERLMQILELKAWQVNKFMALLTKEPEKSPVYVQPYLQYLLRQRKREIASQKMTWTLGKSEQATKERDALAAREYIENFRKINRVLLNGVTPYTISVVDTKQLGNTDPQRIYIDLYDLTRQVSLELNAARLVSRKIVDQAHEKILGLKPDMILTLRDRIQKYHDREITKDTLEENFIGAIFPDERWDDESRAILRKELFTTLGTQNRP